MVGFKPMTERVEFVVAGAARPVAVTLAEAVWSRRCLHALQRISSALRHPLTQNLVIIIRCALFVLVLQEREGGAKRL